MAVSNTVRTYYRLAKPGIVYGNLMTTVAGFLFAAGKTVHLRPFIAVCIGTALVIGSACVINNFIDRDIDKKMQRTQNRALATGTIETADALLYAFALFAFGFAILIRGTNWLTAAVGLIGYIFYVIVYGVAKRTTMYGTLIGSISGSMPIVAGYTAAANRFDAGAWLLFLIMTAWQMPHFYAIAIYRLQDYKAAKIPVWPVKKGSRSTTIHILFYTAVFLAACLTLSVSGHAGYSFAVIMTGIGAYWLWQGSRGLHASDENKWARKLFGFSLITLLVLAGALSLNAWLP